MKKQDILLGMKVVPFKKTAPGWGSLEKSAVWEEARDMGQPFLYVVGFFIETESNLVDGKVQTDTITEYKLNSVKQNGGDFFLASDFRPYTAKKAR